MTSIALGNTATEQQLPPTTLQPHEHQQQPISPPSSQEQQTTTNDGNPRKRRRGANLTRIAIGKLSSSSESLNSNSSANAEYPPTSSSSSSSDEETPSAPFGVEEPKQWAQKRFCPASSSQAAAERSAECAAEELTVVECTSGAKSGSSQVASGGLTLANGLFEIVGDGRECKAVNMHTKTIFHCLIMKQEEYKTFLTVLERLKSAEKLYKDGEEYSQLKNLLVPDETQPIFKDPNWYVLMPDHQGNLTNLHSLVSASNAENNSQGGPAAKVFSERRIQPVFKQIVALVDFCHTIGIYFRDFRLRKFVFTDKERTKIRLNNVLDLWLAPQLNNDQIGQRYKSQVCPVYVAPEILASGVYAGQPADIWALGVLMFSLLTGRFPFHDPNPAALFKRIKARRFSCPVSEAISTNARWLLHGLLRQSPADRPTAAEILRSHWLQLDASALPDGKQSTATQIKHSLSMNSHSVFSSSSSSFSSSASQTGHRGIEAPPAFVRLNSSPAGTVAGLPLQQAAPPQIHVRLALVSARQPMPVGREAPSAAFKPLDDRVDQMVPDVSTAPSAAMDSLITTVSDHYYTRRPTATLSMQSFPPTSNRGGNSP